MIEKTGEMLKWFVSLTPEKAIIALLTSLIIFFGWNSYSTSNSNKILIDKNIDCATKIANANTIMIDKMNVQSEAHQERYDAYRDRVETTNLATIERWKQKYEIMEERLEKAQDKQLKTDEIVNEIILKNKIK